MTKARYNKKVQNLFKQMKPIFEEFFELVNSQKKDRSFTQETTAVISDCAIPFLEAEALLYLPDKED